MEDSDYVAELETALVVDPRREAREQQRDGDGADGGEGGDGDGGDGVESVCRYGMRVLEAGGGRERLYVTCPT